MRSRCDAGSLASCHTACSKYDRSSAVCHTAASRMPEACHLASVRIHWRLDVLSRRLASQGSAAPMHCCTWPHPPAPSAPSPAAQTAWRSAPPLCSSAASTRPSTSPHVSGSWRRRFSGDLEVFWRRAKTNSLESWVQRPAQRRGGRFGGPRLSQIIELAIFPSLSHRRPWPYREFSRRLSRSSSTMADKKAAELREKMKEKVRLYQYVCCCLFAL